MGSTSRLNIYIFRGDGYRVKQNSHGTWRKSSTNRNNGIGKNFIELGGWRFGQVDSNHASIGYKTGTVMIWRSDKTWHREAGPRIGVLGVTVARTVLPLFAVCRRYGSSFLPDPLSRPSLSGNSPTSS